MKLHLFYYTCKKCDTTFKSPQIIGDSYGEFLLRNKSGDIAYLNTFKDLVFNDFKVLYEKVKLKFTKINKANEAKVFKNIFSITCDVSSDGTRYNIGQKPICPVCGKVEIGSWGPTNPTEYIDQDVKIVTHEYWNTLTMEQKKSLLSQAINDCLSEKK